MPTTTTENQSALTTPKPGAVSATRSTARAAFKRWAEKVRVPREEGECWEWTARRLPSGYGMFWYEGRMVYAHRFSHLMLVGEIPDGHHIDHLCRNPCCVNPRHIEAVPPRTNTLRGEGPSALNARKTHCVRGHAFDASNTALDKDGARVCRACVKRKNLKWRSRSQVAA